MAGVDAATVRSTSTRNARACATIGWRTSCTAWRRSCWRRGSTERVCQALAKSEHRVLTARVGQSLHLSAACSYFKREPDGTVSKTQQSIVRTNCMDCLDRTNVVQSMLARRFLHEQLADMGIFDPKEQISEHRAFEIIFRNSASQTWPKHTK